MGQNKPKNAKKRTALTKNEPKQPQTSQNNPKGELN